MCCEEPCPALLPHPPGTHLHRTAHHHGALAPTLVDAVHGLHQRAAVAAGGGGFFLGKGKQLLAARSRPSKISLQYPPKSVFSILQKPRSRFGFL